MTTRAKPKIAKPAIASNGTARTARKARSLKSAKATKYARLEARIDPQLDSLIREAAAIEGRKVTDFVTSALSEAARRTISAAAFLALSREDQAAFASALIDPPRAAPGLERAFVRRKKLLANN